MNASKSRSCDGKNRHHTRGGALAELNVLVRRHGARRGRYNTYSCVHCSGWHVGHKSRYRGQP